MSRHRLLPHPATSAVLLVLWLWLNATVAFGHLVLGTALAVLIPLLVDGLLAPLETDARLRGLGRFVLVVLGDILVANVAVARLILGRTDRLQPAFVEVPLELEQDWAITLLASTVSLTPGTVSAALSADRRTLLVHALTREESEDLAAHIKTRYERPIMELAR